MMSTNNTIISKCTCLIKNDKITYEYNTTSLNYLHSTSNIKLVVVDPASLLTVSV